MTPQGGEPIRKRGYYRALKRGEFWALSKKAMGDLMNDLAREFYSSAFERNPHLAMIGLDKIVNKKD